jgi:hypothetical protein
MPRQAAAAKLVATPARPHPHLAPSSDAPAAVRAIFAEILRSAPQGHFQAGDVHLIEQYAQAIVLARQASAELAKCGPVIGGKTNAWLVVLEKAHRSSFALAARLRLAPQSRADSRSAGRRAGEPRPSIYGLMGDLDHAG